MRDVEGGAQRTLDRVGFSTAMSSTASNGSFRGLSTSTPRSALANLPREPSQSRLESRRLLAIVDGSGGQSIRQWQPSWWVAAVGLAAALLVAIVAFSWSSLSSSGAATGASSHGQSHGLQAARETAHFQQAHFQQVGQRGLCCEEKTAECMACKVGWSVDEFCAGEANMHIRGCQKRCCKEEKATCLACKAGLTVSHYCGRPEHREVPGCKHFCCSKMTAECLACRDHMSTDEYCSKPENARVSGCEDHGNKQPNIKPVKKTTQGPTLAPVTTSSGPHCCSERTAKCHACKAGVSVGEYCIDQSHAEVPGCSGMCGLFEDGYVYPGGNLYDVKNVASAQACCDRCRGVTNCTSWSWGKKPGTTYHGWCYLKNQMEFIRHRDEAFVSGLPGRNMLTFQIKNRHGICLDWAEHLHMAECGGSSKDTQQWYVDRRAGVIGTKHGLCIDSVEYLSPGGGIHLQPCTANLPSQMWAFDGLSGLIRHVRGFCMDAPEFTTLGSKVRIWPCDHQSEEQLWSFWNTQILDQSATRQAMRLEAQTTTTTTTLTTTVSTTTFVATAAESLFCWSLMLPWGYEHHLLQLQYSMGKSIFSCEEFAVYSSEVINITGNDSSFIQTRNVHHDLHCKIGGQFMTALNTPVFLHVWKKLLQDGRYKFHAWTVKSDPDAVFFPQRLRMIVAKTQNPQAGDGIFLNNCQFGLHGPLEVVSRRAMERYAEDRETCGHPPQEDVYLESCLRKLGAREVAAFDVLAEEHCSSKGWTLCQDPHAAFHPFKTVEKYAGCLARAAQFDAETGFQQVRVLHT